MEIYQLEDGLVKLNSEDKNKFIKNNKLFLKEDTFVNDALILKKLESREVALKDENNNIKFIFKFEKFPCLGVWSKPGAPFVCIEPWFNTADKVDSNGKYADKENLIDLDTNEEFEAEYSVEFI